MSRSSPSSLGFGYVVLSKPYEAEYLPLGDHFTLSPVKGVEASTKICIWLGPACTETLVYYICPGHGLINLMPGLNNQTASASAVYTLADLGGFIQETPNVIALELLKLYNEPTILFVRWVDQPAKITAQAAELSLHNYAITTIDRMMKYLEGMAVKTGDAILSDGVAKFFNIQTDGLKKEIQVRRYICDPTLLLCGIIKHMSRTIMEVNQLDIDKGALLVPMCFFRSWSKSCLVMLQTYSAGSISLLSQFLSQGSVMRNEGHDEEMSS